MILSSRERTIVFLTFSVLALFLADRFFLTPVLDRRAKSELESKDLDNQEDKANNIIGQRKRLIPRWREMTDSGLGTGAGDAEIRLLNAIQEWAQEAELNLASVKHERTENEKQFQKITWRAAGTGTMTAVSRFLFRIQDSTMPVRISDLQVGSRQEAGESLSIQVGVSTLCMAAKAESDKAPAEVGKAPVREEKP
jgi:hypothetical protein